MSGDVFVKSSLPTMRVIGNLRQGGFQQDGYSTYLSNKSLDGTEYSAFVIDANGVLRDRFVSVINGVNYRIFGEHNKPAGAYTGDGSAAPRTISTGGVGFACLIWYAGTFTICTPNGSANFSSDGVIYFSPAELKFDDGILTLASSQKNVNNNGSTFMYQVL